MALEDAILPNLCQRCNGAGAHNNRKTCARCEGTGIGKTRSARSRAAQIGVSPATWRNTWQSRLAESARIFAEYDDLINREIRRQLSGQ